MPIQRYSLRDQVRAELVAWLAEDRLKTGQRLEEERLSRALGVSRTPVREALASLVAEGLVEAVPHRGFRVPALSARLRHSARRDTTSCSSARECTAASMPARTRSQKKRASMTPFSPCPNR